MWFSKRPSMDQLRVDPDMALEHRVVFILGEIEEAGTKNTIAKLLYLNSKSQFPIHLLINSVGGDVTCGLAIVDTFSYIKAPVHTHGLDGASGMAALILAAGMHHHRTASPNARLALVPSYAPDGTDPTEIQRVEGILLELLQKCTAQPIKVLEADLRNGRHFSADEAVAYGLVDVALDWNLDSR